MYERVTRFKEFERPRGVKVACANCGNAKRVLRRRYIGSQPIGPLVEKVICSKGQWKANSNGKGGTCDYFAVWSRTQESCPFYDPMGDDLDEFLDSLPQNKSDYLLYDRRPSCP